MSGIPLSIWRGSGRLAAVKERAHIRIDVIMHYLGPRPKALLYMFGDLVMMVVARDRALLVDGGRSRFLQIRVRNPWAADISGVVPDGGAERICSYDLAPSSVASS